MNIANTVKLTPVKREYEVERLEGGRHANADSGIITEPAHIWSIPYMKRRWEEYKHHDTEPALREGLSLQWYQFNLLHRIDGPAVVDRLTGKMDFYLDGRYLTPRAWKDEVEKRTGERPAGHDETVSTPLFRARCRYSRNR